MDMATVPWTPESCNVTTGMFHCSHLIGQANRLELMFLCSPSEGQVNHLEGMFLFSFRRTGQPFRGNVPVLLQKDRSKHLEGLFLCSPSEGQVKTFRGNVPVLLQKDRSTI